MTDCRFRVWPLMLAGLLLSASLTSAQIALPDAPGKALIQEKCLRCHGTEKLAGADNGHWPAFRPGKSREEWQRLVVMMVDYGTPMTPAQVAQAVDYLHTVFPGAARPIGIRVDGPVQATVREWKLRTGTRPHDPAVAPDGAVWYTGQASSLLGRLDPVSGAIREFPLTPDNTKLPYGVGPHGLVADAAGNIWYTGQMDGHLGRLDPKTGKVTKYRMPAGYGGPHTPTIDAKGIVWFTLQQGNRIGRFDPATEQMRFADVPTPKSEPYGIVIDSKGAPQVAQLMGSRVSSVDPATMAVREYFLGQGTGPRRIAVTADDRIFYTDYARGKIGRVDPSTGTVKEWPSPSGPLSQPYAIAAVGSVVWYVEGNTLPNMVVRFDPATEAFQSWPIESGGGVVRHMVVASDGALWLAGSEVDTIARVSVSPTSTSTARR